MKYESEIIEEGVRRLYKYVIDEDHVDAQSYVYADLKGYFARPKTPIDQLGLK